METKSAIQSVLRWWCGESMATTQEELGPKAARWFREGSRLDPVIREEYGALVEAAVSGGLTEWESTLEGRLALIILLDQFTRHVYRDQARMYAGDARAKALSIAMFDSGEAQAMRLDWRHFAMMPMVHAEDVGLQQRGVQEMDAIVAAAPAWLQKFFSMGIEQTRKYLDVVQRFGRFPHRNAILGRETTAEEATFLKTFEGPPKDFEKKIS